MNKTFINKVNILNLQYTHIFSLHQKSNTLFSAFLPLDSNVLLVLLQGALFVMCYFQRPSPVDCRLLYGLLLSTVSPFSDFHVQCDWEHTQRQSTRYVQHWDGKMNRWQRNRCEAQRRQWLAGAAAHTRPLSWPKLLFKFFIWNGLSSSPGCGYPLRHTKATLDFDGVKATNKGQSHLKQLTWATPRNVLELMQKVASQSSCTGGKQGVSHTGGRQLQQRQADEPSSLQRGRALPQDPSYHFTF